MAHDHEHHGEHYFLDQIATVAVCGLMAAIGFLMWQRNLLTEFNILSAQFNVPVLLGSVGLAAVVGVRGATLWREVGKSKAHGHHHHDHAPGEACDHDHSHDGHHHEQHDHAHDHAHVHAHDDGHDHGFAPWRYAVLLLPLMLSGLLLYYHFNGTQLTYSDEALIRFAGKAQQLEGDTPEAKAPKGTAIQTPGLRELNDVAASGNMEYWDGQKARLEGLLSPVGDKEFTLFKLKMTCCAADSVPIKVRIFTKDSWSKSGAQRGKGVTVVGQVQFRKVQDTGEFVPIIVAEEVTPAELGNKIYDTGN